MLGTDKIKQYFATGSSHYVTPMLTAEWNYNLFYPPYATFAGEGQKAINLSGTWAPIAPTVANGKYGANTAKKFTVSNDTHGSSKITVTPASPDTTFGANTYKLVFYAKVLEDVEVTLTSIAYVDSHRSHSDSKLVDSVQWVKFETYVSSKPTDSAYNSFDLTLDYTSTDGSKSYSILIDMIEMYSTSPMEYQYGNLWPTKDPFTFGRPGESYVPSGNEKTPLPTNFRMSSKKSKVMPCSPITYYPNLVIGNPEKLIYRSGILSDTNEYKYFVSDGINNVIGARYEKTFYSNKLVLKFNVAFAVPTLTISLYNGATKYTDILVSAASIPPSGVLVLYLQTNGTWSTTPWSTMPTFNNDGEITNAIAMDKIVVKQTASTVLTGYTTKTSLTSQMNKMQVVEISPRIELDLTQFAMSIDVQTELDNKQNPLPISAISSNSANIKLSNIPLKISAGLLSLFSNNSTNSKLRGLFKKNVKFYVNYVIRDNVIGATTQDKVIPGGVFYSDEWRGQDIGSTTITAFDITKQLQIKSPTDYISVSHKPFYIISNILDMAGFSDYDYDSLYTVANSVKQPIDTSFFFADGKKQKVFEVLREIFEVYQIGAYINAYGVMKFLNLETILKNTTPTMALHDSDKADASTVPGLTIESNIIQDTYTESVKTKVGKATIKYKVPHISKSESTNDAMYKKSGGTNIIDKGDIINTFEEDKIITNHFLYKSIESESQNFFYYDPAILKTQFGGFNVDFEAYGIIEGEIISIKDKEWMFTTDPGKSGQQSAVPSRTFVVSNTNDLLGARYEYSNQAGYDAGITYYPTGKMCNIQRGLFNTPVKKHIVVDTDAKLLDRLEPNAGVSIKLVPGGLFSVPSIKTYTAIVKPKGSDKNATLYNTFSTKMDIGYRAESSFGDQFVGGLYLGTSAGNFYAGILGYDSVSNHTMDWKNKKIVSKGVKTKSYWLTVQQNGVILGDVDVTSIFKDELLEHPDNDPFEEYSRLVNLKLVRTSSSTFEVYLNKKKVNVTDIKSPNLSQINDFGVMSWKGGDSGASINFSEIYATSSVLDSEDVFYHYETKPFLNSIVGEHKSFDVNYMFQVRPRVVGMVIYDAQYQLAPSMTAYPMKAEYTWLNWYTDEKGKYESRFSDVLENYLAYSDVKHTGFRGKIAVVNATNQGVWLSVSASGSNTFDNKFAIKTKDLVALGEEVIISKVFDESNISESIEISSNWVQSKRAAIGILNHIFKTVDGFSRDTRVSVYGNPLFEIGDVVKVNYSLKNIKDQTYFVQGVQQTFATGIQTVLTLNQIGLQTDSSGNTNMQTTGGSSVPLTAPKAPTGLTSYINGGTAILNWVAPVDFGSSPIDNYRVSISPFPSGISGPIMTNSATPTLSVTGTMDTVNYTFQVEAHNASGWGPVSESAKFVTVGTYDQSIQEPSNVGQNGNTISWTSGAGLSTIIKLGNTYVATVTGSSYTFTGIAPGLYYITLTATNGTFISQPKLANIQIY